MYWAERSSVSTFSSLTKPSSFPSYLTHLIILHLFVHLPTVYISHEGMAHSVLFITVPPMVDGRWSIITCCMNKWTNECISGSCPYTIPSLRVLKPLLFMTSAESCLANSGSPTDSRLTKMTVWKPTQACHHILPSIKLQAQDQTPDSP